MLKLNAIDRLELLVLLDRYGLELTLVAPGEAIPGSHWGESEAGLDTPLHSVLHESAHFICMTPERRVGLHTDAGGDDAEETAVCYLQVLMAQALGKVGAQRLFADMDEWGYSFRLGSAGKWFAEDADDAHQWLLGHGLIDGRSRLTYALRQ